MDEQRSDTKGVKVSKSFLQAPLRTPFDELILKSHYKIAINCQKSIYETLKRCLGVSVTVLLVVILI